MSSRYRYLRSSVPPEEDLKVPLFKLEAEEEAVEEKPLCKMEDAEEEEEEATDEKTLLQDTEEEALPTEYYFEITTKFYGEDGISTIFRVNFDLERGYNEFRSIIKQRLDSAPNIPYRFSSDFIIGYVYRDLLVVVNSVEDLEFAGKSNLLKKKLLCIRPLASDLALHESKIQEKKDLWLDVRDIIISIFCFLSVIGVISAIFLIPFLVFRKVLS